MAIKRDGVTIAGEDWPTGGEAYRMLDVQDFDIPFRVRNKNKAMKGKLDANVKVRLMKKLSGGGWGVSLDDLYFTNFGFYKPFIGGTISATPYYNANSDGTVGARYYSLTGYYFYKATIGLLYPSVGFNFFLYANVGGNLEWQSKKIKVNRSDFNFEGSGFVNGLKVLRRLKRNNLLSWYIVSNGRALGEDYMRPIISREYTPEKFDVRLANFTTYFQGSGETIASLNSSPGGRTGEDEGFWPASFSLTDNGRRALKGGAGRRLRYTTGLSALSVTTDTGPRWRTSTLLPLSRAHKRNDFEITGGLINFLNSENRTVSFSSYDTIFNGADASVVFEELENIDLNDAFIDYNPARGINRGKRLPNLKV